MTVSPAAFKSRYAEFSAVSDATVQIYLDDAGLELDEGRWGSLYDRGIYALAAHFISLAQRAALGGSTGAGASGPLASKSIGDVSLSYAWTSGAGQTRNQDYYLATIYGQDYLRLVSVVGYGMVAVV